MDLCVAMALAQALGMKEVGAGGLAAGLQVGLMLLADSALLRIGRFTGCCVAFPQSPRSARWTACRFGRTWA
jgi:hypothetical protein